MARGASFLEQPLSAKHASENKGTNCSCEFPTASSICMRRSSREPASKKSNPDDREAASYRASVETWKDQAESNIRPFPWPRATSPPENFIDFDIGRKTTAYSPGRRGAAGVIW